MNKSITKKLIVWICCLVGVSLLIVSSTIYFLLGSSLRASDQNLLLNLRQTYAELYREGGPRLLENRIPPEILLVVTDAHGKTIFKHFPEYLDHDFEDENEIEQIESAIKKVKISEGWQSILLLSGEENDDIFQRIEYQLRLLAQKKEWETLLPIIDNDLFEINILKLNDSHWLIVGKSSEEREEHLSQVRYISLFVILPFLFVALIFSIIISKKVLKPITDLVNTIKDIKDGDIERRAQVDGSGSETDVLASEFNSLVERNNVLVKNIRETVDNVAHDLRTPITRFRASAEMALSSENNVANLKLALEEAVENSDLILAQLNTIMDVAEAESGTLNLRLEEVSLNRLLVNVLELYSYLADERKIQLLYVPPENLTVRCDIQRMTQALGNILDNAIKYSKENSVINVSTKTHSGAVTITIEDQGIGIPETEIHKIWTRLYRGDASRPTTGLGIGLSLVKAIVEAHNGKVEAQSTHGVGTKILVTLHLCNADEINE
ncbi:MAG: ATP-binding protein [Bacteriovoracaceae bacterium]